MFPLWTHIYVPSVNWARISVPAIMNCCMFMFFSPWSVYRWKLGVRLHNLGRKNGGGNSGRGRVGGGARGGGEAGTEALEADYYFLPLWISLPVAAYWGDGGTSSPLENWGDVPPLMEIWRNVPQLKKKEKAFSFSQPINDLYLK